MKLIVTRLILILVSVGLIGCSTSSWTTINPAENRYPIPLARVTLVGGQQYELVEAIVSEDGVTGSIGGREPVTFPLDSVEKLEAHVSGKNNYSVGIWIAVPVLTAIGIFILTGEARTEV